MARPSCRPAQPASIRSSSRQPILSRGNWRNRRFSDLPAGGRLAYAYRIILKQPVSARYVRVRAPARPGWGMLLSEIQVFDTVTTDTNVPPAVVLPPSKP